MSKTPNAIEPVLASSDSLAATAGTIIPQAEYCEHATAIAQLVEGETAWDQRLIAWSDWINPILVKETRQALKSKQFSWTLMLLTIVVLGWSVIAIIGMIPSIYYASNGSGLLVGYALILVVPAFIIIPQAMFRSMASELEDGTFETLSLSSLSPNMIIMGKLSVAALQLLIYLSVVAPCIALTYLLRGVTLEVVIMVLLIIASCSLALSSIAISIASLSKTRSQQVFFSILVLVGQAITAFFASSTMITIIGTSLITEIGWIIYGVFVLGLIGYGWLLLRCGTCSIGVSSENRSTPIRVSLLTVGLIMAMLQGFFATFYADRSMLSETLGIAVTFLFAHWGISGAMMMGEQGIIPVRARRSLPSSLLGRMFLTWLNPGAGPGYIFVLLSFAGSAFTMAIAAWAVVPVIKSNIDMSLFMYVLALVSYLALYLGLSRLVSMVFLKRMVLGRLLASFVITLVMLIIAVVTTCSMSLAANNYQTLIYEWYCFPNMFWTLGDLFPSSKANWTSPEYFQGIVALAMCACSVALINIVLTAKDVVLLRIETPDRVVRERQKDRNRKPGNDEDEVVDPLRD